MGKKTTVKLTVQQKKEQKEHMKKVMQELANNQKINGERVKQLTSVTDIHLTANKHKHTGLKHRKLPKKQQEESSDEQQLPKQGGIEVEEHPDIEEAVKQKPTLNIFNMDTFQVEGYQEGRQLPKYQHQSKPVELSIEDQAKRQLGSIMTFEKFGEKPLKNKQKDAKPDIEEPVEIRNHPTMQVPTGQLLLNRTPEMTEFRRTLPIAMKEQEIVETINYNMVTLICGETGSGKSTQIPQFLYEKNYPSFGRVAVTQPRRLAAIALAQRVAQEMNVELGKEVCYQVRHQRLEDEQRCCIKFMTDGILMNEMVSDFLLLKYSVIVVDEAHERKVNTDLLVGLLSQMSRIRLRMSEEGKCRPLRLVIMSATLRVEDFNNGVLFNPPPPIAKIEARMFPVTNFFSKITPDDYVNQAVGKCVKIHKRLPAGDVLVFLTGKEEIHTVSILLQQSLERISFEQQEAKEELEPTNEGYVKQNEHDQQIQETGGKPGGYQILQLHSSLPLAEQNLIFRPSTKRKFILSTNIAETSLTIPNIRYVVDSGHQKHKVFDKIWKWYKGWGSRAMAQQRAGRAGRVAHGYCYRLYSTAVYSNIMAEFPEPQISKIPLQNTVLQLKAIGIQDVLRFPFPTCPDREKLAEAINKLLEMNALDGQTIESSFSIDHTKLTELGRVLSFIPLEPLYGKMLLMGRTKHIPIYMLYCLLSLTVETIIGHTSKMIGSKSLQQDEMEEEPEHSGDEIKNFQKRAELRKKLLASNLSEKKQRVADFKRQYAKFYSEGCDLFLPMNIIGEFFVRLLQCKNKKKFNFEAEVRTFSKEHGLIENAMRDIYRNGEQIIEIYETLTNEKLELQEYKRPAADELNLLLDVFLECYPRQLAQVNNKAAYQGRKGEQLHLHPTSFLYSKTPLFVGYFETFQTSRKYMKYPFEVRNYALMAGFGKVNPCKEYLWDKKIGLVGVANGVLGQWEIPPFKVYDTPGDAKYYQIARLFLDGTIFTSMKELCGLYNANPKSCRLENVTEKVQRLVNSIRSRSLTSTQDFLREFNRDQNFLKNELKLWLDRDHIKMNDYDSLYREIRKTILNS